MNDHLLFAALGLLALGGATAVSGRRLSRPEVAALAEHAIQRVGGGVDRLTVMAIVEIESARKPGAERYEAHLGESSVGLMQTLVSTAQWLYDDMGATSLPRPTYESLKDPLTSLYFGARYLRWLRTWRGVGRGEQWYVRAYNGGPGGAEAPATERYWRKYQAAKADLQAEGW